MDDRLSGRHDIDESDRFPVPSAGALPSHIVGLISLVMLALATFAYYGRHLSGIWRPIYTITAVLSLYLNVFVVIIPSFLKIPPLESWAPTQTEPAFLVVQGSVLVLFIVLAILTTVRFRHSPAHPNDNPSGSAPEVHGNLVFTFGQTSPKKLRVDR